MGLILYSTNTWLAYIISEKFYSGLHYVWCTPHAHTNNQTVIDTTTPPTSTPIEMFRALNQEVTRGDRHSAKIKENKLGVLRGAAIKRKQSIITEKEEEEIKEIVGNTETRDFRPLFYVIPYGKVEHLLRSVPVADRAHPLSVEYVIEELPRNLFDVIEI
ncbi:MAG TPA: hypothetical protein VE035_06215 [Puia sp.]|nr:hypothetical protein [Puia sp.]